MAAAITAGDNDFIAVPIVARFKSASRALREPPAKCGGI
jgi:hypothetical protein